ncbi:unnamed protein product [Alternaria alternata]
MIRGKPGSGKSTAMKRAFNIAREEAPEDEVTIAFFFNSRGIPMETKLEGLFRSTLHQLFRRHNPANDALAEWKQKASSIKPGWAWTSNELRAMFVKHVLSSPVKVTVFIDALDECESSFAARDLMDLLTRSGQYHDSGQSPLKICVSCRHYPNVGVAEPLQITVEDTNQNDIAKYIQMTLRRTKIDMSEGFCTEITSRSEGIFFWAFLVMQRIREAIESGGSQQEVKAVMNRTPRRLEEVFKELTDDISSDERERSNLILSWILFAKRPLFLSELDHALAFRSEYRTYLDYENSDNFVHPEQARRSLAKYTRGLVEAVQMQAWSSVDPTMLPTFRVQFIHESVRQYMLANLGVVTSGLDANWSKPGFVDHILAQSCFNYIKAVCVESDVINKVVWRLRDVAQIRGDSTKDRPFLRYAMEFGLEHAKVADAKGIPPSYLFQFTVTESTASALWWISFTSVFGHYWRLRRHTSACTPGIKRLSENPTTELDFACVYHLNSWVDHLLQHPRPDLNKLHWSKALCVAAAFGNEKSLTSLIEAGADVDYDEPVFGTPLCSSLAHGRDDMTAILLRRKATVRMGSRKHSPLVAAVSHSPVNSVRLLLAAGAEIIECETLDPSPWDSPLSLGLNALQASIQRDVKILKALLPSAERQRVPVEHYKAAYLSAVASEQEPHAGHLKSAVERLFTGHSTISIVVKTLTGKTIELTVWADTQIHDLKKVIEFREGVPPDQIALVYGTKVLYNQRTLRYYMVQQESTIHMLLATRWGGRFSGG